MSDKSVIFDEIIDASFDKMIEKDIIELEDSFYNCFHVELHEPSHHGSNSTPTLQERHIGHLKTRVSTAEEVIKHYRTENLRLRSTLKSSAVKIENESKQYIYKYFQRYVERSRRDEIGHRWFMMLSLCDFQKNVNLNNTKEESFTR